MRESSQRDSGLLPSREQVIVITARAFAGKHYAVYGLARSGLATVEALLASGAKVTAGDAKEEAREQLQSSPSWSRGGGSRAAADGGAPPSLGLAERSPSPSDIRAECG